MGGAINSSTKQIHWHGNKHRLPLLHIYTHTHTHTHTHTCTHTHIHTHTHTHTQKETRVSDAWANLVDKSEARRVSALNIDSLDPAIHHITHPTVIPLGPSLSTISLQAFLPTRKT